VHLGNGFVSDTSYFDATGKLVAAVRTTDQIDPTCKGRFTYGIEITCERVPTEGYCEDVPPFPTPPPR
jgi:hypothetical protein